MQVAAAGTGVRVSDGSTNVLPIGPRRNRSTTPASPTYGLTRRALARAYYQGWDMHPGHIPTRYAAVFAFYREGFEQAAARLSRYANHTDGDVMDEPCDRQGPQRLPTPRGGIGACPPHRGGGAGDQATCRSRCAEAR